MSESLTERNVCEYAEDVHKYYAIKITASDSRNGLPDRLFIGYNTSIFFIEFKASGEEPRPLQQFYINVLKKMGFRVYVVDDEQKGKNIIDQEIRRAKKEKRNKKGN